MHFDTEYVFPIIMVLIWAVYLIASISIRIDRTVARKRRRKFKHTVKRRDRLDAAPGIVGFVSKDFLKYRKPTQQSVVTKGPRPPSWATVASVWLCTDGGDLELVKRFNVIYRVAPDHSFAILTILATLRYGMAPTEMCIVMDGWETKYVIALAGEPIHAGERCKLGEITVRGPELTV